MSGKARRWAREGKAWRWKHEKSDRAFVRAWKISQGLFRGKGPGKK